MPLSEYQQKLRDQKIYGKPKEEKKIYRIPKVSKKKAQEMKAEKEARGGKKTDLQEWYEYHMKNSVPVCDNCRMEANWLLKPEFEKIWHACQSHVLPKAKSQFPSIACNLENHLVLFPSWGGLLCGCHGWYDSSWFNASTMDIWPRAKQIIFDLIPRLQPNEIKKLPDIIRNELKEIQ